MDDTCETLRGELRRTPDSHEFPLPYPGPTTDLADGQVTAAPELPDLRTFYADPSQANSSQNEGIQTQPHNSLKKVAKSAALLAIAGTLLAPAQEAEGKVPFCKRDAATNYKVDKPYSDQGKVYKGSGNCRSIKFKAKSKRPKGLVIIPAASGWTSSPEMVEAAYGTLPAVAKDAGYDATVVEVTSYKVDGKTGFGRQGVANAKDWVRHYGRRYEKQRKPVVVGGLSAGGHLALMAAGSIKTIDGVITLGAPTNLGKLTTIKSVAVDAFGLGNLRRYSPSTNPTRYKGTPMLMAQSRDDLVVPSDGLGDFAASIQRLPGKGRLKVYYTRPTDDCSTPDNRAFIHACAAGKPGETPMGVTPGSVREFNKIAVSFLRGLRNRERRGSHPRGSDKSTSSRS